MCFCLRDMHDLNSNLCSSRTPQTALQIRDGRREKAHTLRTAEGERTNLRLLPSAATGNLERRPELGRHAPASLPAATERFGTAAQNLL